jgi:hypothetical protein
MTALASSMTDDADDEYDPRPYIEAQLWVFASTMPEQPHFYVVLQRSTDRAEHMVFLRWIRRTGERKTFAGQAYRYATVDGWRYWSVGTVINRRKATRAERRRAQPS